MPVVTMLNMKGGVGKSSTCHHLAGTLSAEGRKVLLVDNDPQSSLSQGFWGPVATAAIDPAETVAALYSGDDPFPERVIRPTGVPGVDLMPGSMAAADFNVPRPQDTAPGLQSCLRDFLSEVRGSYDLILIDCPPNLHLCSWAALVASDFLIVPLQPEDYGSQGIASVWKSFDMVRAGPNPGLEMLGLLMTMYNGRTVIHRMFEKTLRDQYGPLVFAAAVPFAVDLKEAVTRRLPIAQFKPRGASAKALRAVADEVLAAMGPARRDAVSAGGVA